MGAVACQSFWVGFCKIDFLLVKMENKKTSIFFWAEFFRLKISTYHVIIIYAPEKGWFSLPFSVLFSYLLINSNLISNRRFWAIELCQSALSEEEELLLLMLLHEKRLRTNDAGTTRAEPHGYGWSQRCPSPCYLIKHAKLSMSLIQWHQQLFLWCN